MLVSVCESFDSFEAITQLVRYDIIHNDRKIDVEQGKSKKASITEMPSSTYLSS